MTREIWRPVVGFEGLYEVSSQGRVRGIPRKGCHGKILVGCATGSLLYFAVWLSRDGRARPFLIHRLVAAAFIGPRPAQHDVAHNNGDRYDNCVTNLRYATRSENNKDKRLHGRVPVGSKTSAAKLTEAHIPAIRALQGTWSARQTARLYGVGHAAILNVWHRRNWAHV